MKSNKNARTRVLEYDIEKSTKSRKKPRSSNPEQKFILCQGGCVRAGKEHVASKYMSILATGADSPKVLTE